MNIKLALCQINVVSEKQKNIINAKQKIESAVNLGADIICLPEIFNGLYANEHFINNAEEEGGETYLFLQQAAKEYRVHIVGGSISEREGKNLFNTSYFFSDTGRLIAKHRKVHLFDIEVPNKIYFKESDTFKAGNEFTVVDTKFGKIGLAICFDIRFAEQFRIMSQLGAKLVIVPGAFNMTTGPAHWELAFRSRAVDNQFFVAGCAPARNTNSSYVSYGNSLIVNPWGEVLGSLNENEGILIKQIDLNEVEKIRNQLPIIKNMRNDLYGSIK